MRFGGALYLACAALTVLRANTEGLDLTSTQVLVPALILALVGLTLAVGPEKSAVALKDYVALLVVGSVVSRVILTGMSVLTDVGFKYCFTEPRDAVLAVGAAAATLLLLVGRPGSLRVTFALLTLGATIYAAFMLPPD